MNQNAVKLEQMLELDRILANLQKAPPGPPPRAGLEWREQTHRWFRPEETSSKPARVSGDADDISDIEMWSEYGSKTSQVQWVKPKIVVNAKGKESRQSMSGIPIPPAWTNVAVNKDPKGDQQVIALGPAGDVVRLMHADFVARQSKIKYAREKEFAKKLPAFRKRLRADFNTFDEAKALYIIDKTGFRIGTRGSGNDHRGVTTLQGKHVTLEGNLVEFDFVGKSGVRNHKIVESSGLARFLRQRKKVKGPEDQLFAVHDSHVRLYMQKVGMTGFSPKDFRTHQGTELAKQIIKEAPKPTTEKELKALKKQVADEVSAWLSNKPSTALGSYINPQVFSKYDKALMKAVEELVDWRAQWEPEFDWELADYTYMTDSDWYVLQPTPVE